MQQYKLVMHQGSYALYWREDGQPRRRSLGTKDQIVALRRKAEFERLIAEQNTAVSSFADLWWRYQESLEGRPTAKHMKYEAVRVLPHFGHLLPTGITEQNVKDFMAARRKAGRSEGTILLELTRVRGAYGGQHPGIYLKQQKARRRSAGPCKSL